MTQEMPVIYTNEKGEEFRYMEEVLFDDGKAKLIYVDKIQTCIPFFITENNDNAIWVRSIYKIKPPQLKPWTYETVPVPPFAIKGATGKTITTVTTVAEYGVTSTGYGTCSYEYLLNQCVMVDKDKNEFPCGVEV